ncbi:MAG: hypothetical protein L0Y54_09150 [Sporichthyaceae bacterium]|nr:hypothetical protein [Sporichthyaceae bacterium]
MTAPAIIAAVPATARAVVLGCLPPTTDSHPDAAAAAVSDLLGRALAGVPAAVAATGFVARPGLGPPERARLIRPTVLCDGLLGCAGGPVGLLDLAATAAVLELFAEARWHQVRRVTAGTGPALPYHHFYDRHLLDPAGYPLGRANAEFAAQPRVAAMLARDTAEPDPDLRFDCDDYGPGLPAHQGGLADLVGYAAGCFLGDALVTSAGELITPHPGRPRGRLTHSLPARLSYHARAGAHLASLDPRSVIVALVCDPAGPTAGIPNPTPGTEPR